MDTGSPNCMRTSFMVIDRVGRNTPAGLFGGCLLMLSMSKTSATLVAVKKMLKSRAIRSGFFIVCGFHDFLFK